MKVEIGCMTAGQINKALDKMEKLSSKLVDDFIDAGRGHEQPSEIRTKDDPLAKKWIKIHDELFELRLEISRRYGLNAPSRLPRGFGPLSCNKKRG